MKINLTPNEFADFVAAFLFDKILNDDVIPNNEEFNKFSEALEKKGVKPLLMRYYMSMDSDMRINYKRIKDSFTGKEMSMNTINITRSDDTEKIEEPKGKIAKVKKIAKRVAKRVIRAIAPKILGASDSFSEEDLEKMLVEEILIEEEMLNE